MKLCADCRHMQPRFQYDETVGPEEHLCGRTKMINTVTGEPFYRSCVQERRDGWRRFFSGNCGAAGVHWEPKPAPDGPVQFRWETPSDAAAEED